MKIGTLVLVGLAIVLAASVSAKAVSLVNGSFENRLTGWATYERGGVISAVMQHDSVPYGTVTYGPTDGNYFALLCAGDVNRWVSIQQDFTVDVGPQQVLSFDWFFDSNEGAISIEQGYNDQAGVFINGRTIFEIRASDLPPDGETRWTHQSVALPPAAYRLEMSVMNVGDGLFPSYLGVDDVGLTTGRIGSVPEPLTVIAVFSGVVGLGGYMRRRWA